MTRHKEEILQNKTGTKVNKQVTQKTQEEHTREQRKPKPGNKCNTNERVPQKETEKVRGHQKDNKSQGSQKNKNTKSPKVAVGCDKNNVNQLCAQEATKNTFLILKGHPVKGISHIGTACSFLEWSGPYREFLTMIYGKNGEGVMRPSEEMM